MGKIILLKIQLNECTTHRFLSVRLQRASLTERDATANTAHTQALSNVRPVRNGTRIPL